MAKELLPPAGKLRPGVATAKTAEEMVGAVPPALRGAVPGRVPRFKDGILENRPGRWLDPAVAGEVAGKAPGVWGRWCKG